MAPFITVFSTVINEGANTDGTVGHAAAHADSRICFGIFPCQLLHCRPPQPLALLSSGGPPSTSTKDSAFRRSGWMAMAVTSTAEPKPSTSGLVSSSLQLHLHSPLLRKQKKKRSTSSCRNTKVSNVVMQCKAFPSRSVCFIGCPGSVNRCGL